MKKTGFVAMTLFVGLLLGLSIPAMALSVIDAKQKRQIKALQARVAVIENAPDTTTGLADEVNRLKERDLGHDSRLDNHAGNLNYLLGKADNLDEKTGQLDRDGVYSGVVRRFQIKLSDDDGCSNGQPRAAVWNTGNLAC